MVFIVVSWIVDKGDSELGRPRLWRPTSSGFATYFAASPIRTRSRTNPTSGSGFFFSPRFHDGPRPTRRLVLLGVPMKRPGRGAGRCVTRYLGHYHRAGFPALDESAHRATRADTGGRHGRARCALHGRLS